MFASEGWRNARGSIRASASRGDISFVMASIRTFPSALARTDWTMSCIWVPTTGLTRTTRGFLPLRGLRSRTAAEK